MCKMINVMRIMYQYPVGFNALFEVVLQFCLVFSSRTHWEKVKIHGILMFRFVTKINIFKKYLFFIPFTQIESGTRVRRRYNIKTLHTKTVFGNVWVWSKSGLL